MELNVVIGISMSNILKRYISFLTLHRDRKLLLLVNVLPLAILPFVNIQIINQLFYCCIVICVVIAGIFLYKNKSDIKIIDKRKDMMNATILKRGFQEIVGYIIATVFIFPFFIWLKSPSEIPIWAAILSFLFIEILTFSFFFNDFSK